jgi:3-dehydroquinate dehydratase II
MAKPIYVLNGPNLNTLGRREPTVYGTVTLDEIRQMAAKRAAELGLTIEFRQSNHEGALIDWVQEAADKACGIIINGGALTHTSIALMDAVRGVDVPVLEVHLSNIFRRERYRHHSYISPVSTGLICGLGPKGYELAVEAMAQLVAGAGQKGR